MVSLDNSFKGSFVMRLEGLQGSVQAPSSHTVLYIN